MFRSELRRALAAALLVAALVPSSARAEDDVSRARSEFVTATEHVKYARWGEALAAFERSAALRPHALTIFNIGACERALGRYTRARVSLTKALSTNAASGNKELAGSFVADATKWVEDIDRMLVHATITIQPADATLLIDGSPAEKITNGKVSVVLDPGPHVFALSRSGFSNALVTETLAPGSTPAIALDLTSLPATLRIASDRSDAVVTVNDVDVGIAPVQVTRPAGSYTIRVRKPGFVTYQSKVNVGPGEHPSIQANLPAETTPVTKKVWFWSAIGVVVAGAAVGTYFLTRPEPQRPAPDGGALGWVVTVPTSH